MQQFAVVDDKAAYMPLQGFTTADLGYERGNAVSNMVHRIDDAPMTSQYIAAVRPDLEQPRRSSTTSPRRSTTTSPACTPRTRRRGSTS